MEEGQVVDWKQNNKSYKVREVQHNRVLLIREQSGEYQNVPKSEVLD